MAENDPNPNEPDPNAPDPDDAALVAEVEDLTRPSSEKDQDKVKNALIAAKRDLRVANRRVKELEPIAAGVTDTTNRLNSVQPMIDALANNPRLRAEAIRISQGGGTRPTPETTNQPDDPDLVQYAEESGFFLADGVTPDAARANRVLTLLARRSGVQVDERLRPVAGLMLGSRAEENIRTAMAATDEDGTPWASRESFEEVVKELPRDLLADPKVANLILTQAIGLDRMKKRTPKPQDEPLFLERQGGGGNRREAPLDKMERAHLAASGISEKDYRASAARLEQGAASRKGIELGK